MIGKNTVKKIVNYVIRKSKADEVQITIQSEDSFLTRFANSTIHQNVMETNTKLTVTSRLGKKIGFSTTTRLNKANIDQTLEHSYKIAKHSPSDDYATFPSMRKYKQFKTYYRSTHFLSGQKKSEIINQIARQSHPFLCFGAFTTGATEIAIANNRNLFAYNEGTDYALHLTMKGTSGSGSAQCAGRNINEFHFETLTNRAYNNTLDAQNPRNIKTGKYTVLLSPNAVSEIIEFLSFLGFNSRLYLEGRSCISGKLGKKIFDKRLTILDNPTNEDAFAFPFDFEGEPKKKTTLVKNGVLRSLVYDRTQAKKAGKQTTGNFVSREFGPLPMHLEIIAGKQALNIITKKIKRGIEITTFHYVNVVDPKTLVLTGMTRNGTFVIENGQRSYPVKNLRFNQNILNLFKNIIAISAERHLIHSGNSYSSRFPIGSILPYIIVPDFNFTGTTEF